MITRDCVAFGSLVRVVAWRESTFQLTWARTGVEHLVTVSEPLRYDRLIAVPLIICLDGPWVAGTVRDATRLMSMNGEAPEAVVVGVSFADDSMSAYLASRARWFTPTPFVPPEETGVAGLAAEDCGHAFEYLDFVRDQLLPRIEAQYRIDGRWFVGHSFSALFGLYTLFTSPWLFDRYLLASPSIWWDDRSILTIEERYAAQHTDLGAWVFMSAGDEETAGDYRMQANVEDLCATLAGRDYTHLDVMRSVIPGENHHSTVGAAISRGMRTLMAQSMPAPAPRLGTTPMAPTRR